jgi:hypothetical protein
MRRLCIAALALLANPAITAQSAAQADQWSRQFNQGYQRCNQKDPVYAALDTGLAGYWKLDETRRVLATDASGNDNDLVMNNTSFGVASVDLDGEQNRAVSFTTADDDDVIKAVESSTLALTSDISLCAWIVTRPGADSDNRIAGKSDAGGTYGYALDYDSFHVAGGSCTRGPRTKLSTAITQGVWYHLCGVYDDAAQTISLYKDGRLVAGPETHPHGVCNVSRRFAIGGRQSGGGGIFSEHDGYIDEVRLYDRPLSGEEIERLHGCSAPLYTKFP